MNHVIADHYHVSRLLGQGGMKVVFLAEDARDSRQVAVAVINAHPESFEREVSLAQRVHDPHVAAVLDSGVGDDGKPYIVSEYCDGPTLKTLLQHEGPQPEARALDIARQVASGLQSIHEAHILHRDMKLENLILTEAGVKIIDFGISLPAIDTRSAVGPPVPLGGTPGYMAIEAFAGSGEELDARTDVYAFGVCLFELLSQRLPLEPTRYWFDHVDQLRQIVAHDLSPLSGIGVEFRRLIQSMIAMDKGSRPYMPEVSSALWNLTSGA